MQPQDDEALEQAHWSAFVDALAAHLAAQWPAMPERLGERYAAFVEHAVAQAEKRGLGGAVAVARYVNLWFVWGPAYHDKPGFEWAAGLLAAPREREWSTVHQLVRRSMAELQRLPGTRIEPAALAASDERLIERFGALGRRGALHPAEPPLLPRRACDLEAAELRLLEPAVAEHYVLKGGQGAATWQRAPIALPPPLRVEAASPLPPLLAVLSQPPGQRPQARLQLRLRAHAQCDGSVHPAARFAGTHGLWGWAGPETRTLSWPLTGLARASLAAGPGMAIAEETSPDIFRLELLSCGLRDEGDAIGPQQTLVWVWPAAQWWLELERLPAAAQPVRAGQAPALRDTTQARVECDARAQDALPLRRAFEQGLDAARDAALQALLAGWSAVPGLSAPRLDGALALLVGRAAFTWGWCLGAGGLDGRALMRLVGTLAMQAVQAELEFEGELALAGGRARVQLRCVGQAPLAATLQREQAEPALLPVLQPALVRFSLPFTAGITPLATEHGALLQAAGPCTGALVGEAGLRPRTSGGSGFEWFAALRLEPVLLSLALVDPVLGARRFTHALWPARTLVDWRLA
ncbi:MAG: hypothetical protein KGK09_02450 [Burkholderiales bacterium]|nr:hypothetical protein [Burkholderiales bacterium]